MLRREPLLLAAGAGIFVSLSGLSVWQPLTVAIQLLGDISIDLMIFSVGVRSSNAKLGAWRIGVVGACVPALTGMLVAWAFGELAGLSLLEQNMLLLFGALPPAVSSFIFVERHQQEPDKVASIVMIGNACALLFVPLAPALRL